MQHILITLFLLLTPALLQAQQPKAHLVEVLSIGDDESEGPEYLFTSPRHIAVDTQGHIYIADSQSKRIKAFDKAGRFVKYLGIKGNGPGEIQDVSALIVNQEDQIIVVDRFSQRATAFSLTSESVETFPLLNDQYQDVLQALPLANGTFVLGYKSAFSNTGHDPKPELLHLVSNDFSTTRASLADYNQFYDDGTSFLKMLSLINPIRMATDGHNNLYVAPLLYEGKIFQLSLENAQAGPTVLTGYSTSYPAYEELHHPDFSNKNPNVLHISHVAFGKASVLIQKRSLGLFLLSDGRLVHFTKMGKGVARTYGVELFSADGNFEGYFPIEGYQSTTENPLKLTPLAIDQNDQFYVTDDKNGFPVVRIVKLALDSN